MSTDSLTKASKFHCFPKPLLLLLAFLVIGMVAFLTLQMNGQFNGVAFAEEGSGSPTPTVFSTGSDNLLGN